MTKKTKLPRKKVDIVPIPKDSSKMCQHLHEHIVLQLFQASMSIKSAWAKESLPILGIASRFSQKDGMTLLAAVSRDALQISLPQMGPPPCCSNRCDEMVAWLQDFRLNVSHFCSKEVLKGVASSETVRNYFKALLPRMLRVAAGSI